MYQNPNDMTSPSGLGFTPDGTVVVSVRDSHMNFDLLGSSQVAHNGGELFWQSHR